MHGTTTALFKCRQSVRALSYIDCFVFTQAFFMHGTITALFKCRQSVRALSYINCFMLTQAFCMHGTTTSGLPLSSMLCLAGRPT
jgi:hypothetical protein